MRRGIFYNSVHSGANLWIVDTCRYTHLWINSIPISIYLTKILAGIWVGFLIYKSSLCCIDNVESFHALIKWVISWISIKKSFVDCLNPSWRLEPLLGIGLFNHCWSSSAFKRMSESWSRKSVQDLGQPVVRRDRKDCHIAKHFYVFANRSLCLWWANSWARM